MVNVTINATRVLDRLKLTTTEIPADKVEVFIDDAITAIEQETGATLGELAGDAGSKSLEVLKKYAPVITNLSAIYCICYMTGGSAVGLSYSVGGLSVSVLSGAPPLSVLEREVQKSLNQLKDIAFVIGEDTN